MVGKYGLEHPADCQATSMRSHTYAKEQDDLLGCSHIRVQSTEHWDDEISTCLIIGLLSLPLLLPELLLGGEAP